MPVTERVLALSGDYDVWRRHELRAELDAVEASGKVIIDLSRVTFMDAGAVGLLLALRKRIYDHDRSGCVVLRNTPHIVRRVLEIAHAEDLFEFSP